MAGAAEGAAIRTIALTDDDGAVTGYEDRLYVTVAIGNECHSGWCGLDKHILYEIATVTTGTEAGGDLITRGDVVSHVDIPEYSTMQQIIAGLGYDGEFLIATLRDGHAGSWGMDSFIQINPDNGNRLREIWFYDPEDWGYFQGQSTWTDVTFDAGEEVMYFTRGKEVMKVNVDGRKIGAPWTVTGLGDIKGTVLYTDSSDNKYIS